jgi:hypothetical protein
LIDAVLNNLDDPNTDVSERRVLLRQYFSRQEKIQKERLSRKLDGLDFMKSSNDALKNVKYLLNPSESFPFVFDSPSGKIVGDTAT